MISLPLAEPQRNRLRTARVGDILPSSVVPRGSGRGIEATAVLLPGEGSLDDYLDQLRAAESDFAEWDGRLLLLPPDDSPAHRLLIVDRYGQVYWTGEARAADHFPGADELGEWFKFLATACPECGVLDDPATEREWVP